MERRRTAWCRLMKHGTDTPHCSRHKYYECPTWMACRSRLLRSLTSSNGHRLDSMRRWARMSFRSLFGGLPEAGGDTGGNAAGAMGLMASTFLMTTWHMFSMASLLERASRLPSPSHLPKDSCSCTSIFWCRTNTCAALQRATKQMTHNTVFVDIKASKQCLTIFYYCGHAPELTFSFQHIFAETSTWLRNRHIYIYIYINFFLTHIIERLFGITNENHTRHIIMM